MNDNSDQFIEVNGSSEDEDDFGALTKKEIAGVAIATTDWTTETVLSQLTKGNIQLNPGFQRRDAWEPKRKSQFIESLILGLPVPQIVLAERMDQKGTYIVLDGKQRLLCLRQFTAPAGDVDYHSFALSDLVVRTDLNRKSYSDLLGDLHFRADVTALENYGIRAVLLRNWKTEKLLGHVFLRLNMGSKALSPQELRQALHPGPFLDFVDAAAARSTAIKDILGKNEPDFRMRDVELMIRYLSFRHLLERYRGNLKEFLDETCAHFNKHWDSLRPQLTQEAIELDHYHKLIKTAFGERYNYGKWLGPKFEPRFNRAVFDVLIQALTVPGVFDIIASSPEKMTTAFKNICSSDEAFLNSIERTTKSVDATRYRLHAWASALSDAYACPITPPSVGPTG